MAEERSDHLERRRDELTRSLPRLSEKQANTYRLNSDARALDRAGVKHQASGEMERLKGNEAAADTAIRDAQRELRQLDVDLEGRSVSWRNGLKYQISASLWHTLSQPSLARISVSGIFFAW